MKLQGLDPHILIPGLHPQTDFPSSPVHRRPYLCSHTQTLRHTDIGKGHLSPVGCSWLRGIPELIHPSIHEDEGQESPGLPPPQAILSSPGSRSHLLIISPTQLQQSLLVLARSVILERKRERLPLTQTWVPLRQGRKVPQCPKQGKAEHLFTAALTPLLLEVAETPKQWCAGKYSTTGSLGKKEESPDL